MATNNAPGASRQRGAWVLGLLMVLAGLALNKWSLEKLFSADEHISSSASIATIYVFDAVLIAVGLFLVLRRPRLALPAIVRGLAGLGLTAGVVLGAYGTLKANGYMDPNKETRKAWTTMAAGEELIFELTPQFKVISKSLDNLRLPDPPSQSIFEAQVNVVDLQPIPSSGYKKISDTGIETPDWKVAAAPTTVPLASLSLWQPFMERVDYVIFPWTEFKAVKAKFLDEARTTFEINLAFQGVGRLKNGGWVWIKALNDVRWRKQSSDSGGPAKWKIYEWRTAKFNTWERNELMFGEVLDVVMPKEDAARARRSIHEEMRLEWMMEKEKKSPHPHFTLEAVDRHPGLAVVDIDGDGFDDIYFLADYGKNMLFRNKGDGTFEEIAAKLGLDLEGHSSSAIFADFDNDGHLDVMIGRTLSPSVYMHWENGKYVDRSDWISKGKLPYLVSSVSAVDYDGDGLLDIYLSTYASNIAYWENAKFSAESMRPYLPAEQVAELQRIMDRMDNPFTNLPGPPNVLLHNIGGGKFEVVADSPLAVYKNTYQATWSDYDGDGKPDVLLANDFSPPTLFHNLGGGKFADVTREMGLNTARFGMGATWGDYDGDGKNDLYIAAMSSKAGRRILSQLPDADPTFAVMAAGNALYHNEPGKLVKTSGASAPKLTVEQSGWDYGAQLVDLNNDGWLDIFSLSGYYSAPKSVETDFDL